MYHLQLLSQVRLLPVREQIRNFVSPVDSVRIRGRVAKQSIALILLAPEPIRQLLLMDLDVREAVLKQYLFFHCQVCRFPDLRLPAQEIPPSFVLQQDLYHIHGRTAELIVA